jgi:serine phosphatase RsbU (regulator of sigma subunit)
VDLGVRADPCGGEPEGFGRPCQVDGAVGGPQRQRLAQRGLVHLDHRGTRRLQIDHLVAQGESDLGGGVAERLVVAERSLSPSRRRLLHSPDLARHTNVAVRYLPAKGSLNVCGDWYDTVDLSEGRFTVSVGDVVGHGLEAATVMGMLRSALSAASRAVAGPAQALEVLGMYARSIDGALAATAVSVLVDTRSRLLVYSSAGHLPPVLLRADGTCELLDQATDPPLGARPEHVPRPQAGIPYRPGDTLVLYTDGLIERRDEDIDASLHRLTTAVGGLTGLEPQPLADALLTQLGVARGARDDIALVVVGL